MAGEPDATAVACGQIGPGVALGSERVARSEEVVLRRRTLRRVVLRCDCGIDKRTRVDGTNGAVRQAASNRFEQAQRQAIDSMHSVVDPEVRTMALILSKISICLEP